MWRIQLINQFLGHILSVFLRLQTVLDKCNLYMFSLRMLKSKTLVLYATKKGESIGCLQQMLRVESILNSQRFCSRQRYLSRASNYGRLYQTMRDALICNSRAIHTNQYRTVENKICLRINIRCKLQVTKRDSRKKTQKTLGVKNRCRAEV